MNWLRRRISGMGARLLLSYLAVCAVGTVVLYLTVRATAPSFFDHHIAGMPGMRGPGTFRAQEGARLDEALARSLNEGFLIATAVALPLGVLASVLMARQIATPIRHLADASRRIAGGEYSRRVPVEGPREIRDLAGRFNAMAQALEQVEQRRVELIGEVAHELRTPVTVLHGYVEGLADGVFPPSHETWERLQEETRRLGRLVEELQELSRAESGRIELRIVPVDAAAAVRAAAGRLGGDVRAGGLGLQVDVPTELPPMAADPDRLSQILTNLLTNAVRYTPPPGTVVMAAWQEPDSVAISVRDSGIGIASEHIPYVFERFYRVDRSRARASGGSGVGLTIARALAIAMGGTLDAASDGPGQGATFTLRLPRFSTATPVAPAPR